MISLLLASYPWNLSKALRFKCKEANPTFSWFPILTFKIWKIQFGKPSLNGVYNIWVIVYHAFIDWNTIPITWLLYSWIHVFEFQVYGFNLPPWLVPKPCFDTNSYNSRRRCKIERTNFSYWDYLSISFPITLFLFYIGN